MKRIIFATGNEGKMKEIRMILADLQVAVLSMKEAGLQTDVRKTERALQKMQISKPLPFRSFHRRISFWLTIPDWRSMP